uniref:DUF4780 domain-containing protein n=1 Tax=Cacopsylla melanoneura TaxID=428564 RepID=A0A8D9EEF1_9HEMI
MAKEVPVNLICNLNALFLSNNDVPVEESSTSLISTTTTSTNPGDTRTVILSTDHRLSSNSKIKTMSSNVSKDTSEHTDISSPNMTKVVEQEISNVNSEAFQNELNPKTPANQENPDREPSMVPDKPAVNSLVVQDKSEIKPPVVHEKSAVNPVVQEKPAVKPPFVQDKLAVKPPMVLEKPAVNPSVDEPDVKPLLVLINNIDEIDVKPFIVQDKPAVKPARDEEIPVRQAKNRKLSGAQRRKEQRIRIARKIEKEFQEQRVARMLEKELKEKKKDDSQNAPKTSQTLDRRPRKRPRKRRPNKNTRDPDYFPPEKKVSTKVQKRKPKKASRLAQRMSYNNESGSDLFQVRTDHNDPFGERMTHTTPYLEELFYEDPDIGNFASPCKNEFKSPYFGRSHTPTYEDMESHTSVNQDMSGYTTNYEYRTCSIKKSPSYYDPRSHTSSFQGQRSQSPPHQNRRGSTPTYDNRERLTSSTYDNTSHINLDQERTRGSSPQQIAIWDSTPPFQKIRKNPSLLQEIRNVPLFQETRNVPSSYREDGTRGIFPNERDRARDNNYPHEVDGIRDNSLYGRVGDSLPFEGERAGDYLPYEENRDRFDHETDRARDTVQYYKNEPNDSLSYDEDRFGDSYLNERNVHRDGARDNSCESGRDTDRYPYGRDTPRDNYLHEENRFLQREARDRSHERDRTKDRYSHERQRDETSRNIYSRDTNRYDRNKTRDGCPPERERVRDRDSYGGNRSDRRRSDLNQDKTRRSSDQRNIRPGLKIPYGDRPSHSGSNENVTSHTTTFEPRKKPTRAQKRKMKNTQSFASSQPPLGNRSTITGIRGRSPSGIPSEGPPSKKLDTKTVKAPTEVNSLVAKAQSNVSNVVKMAVAPADYPKSILSKESADRLSLRLLNMFRQLADGSGPQFRCKKHQANSILVLHCENQLTATWLEESVQTIGKWDGVDLMVKPLKLLNEKLKPTKKVLTRFPPVLDHKEVADLLEMLQWQNSKLGLKFSDWRILETNRQPSARTVVFAMTEMDVEILRTQNFKLFCGLNQIRLSLLD